MKEGRQFYTRYADFIREQIEGEAVGGSMLSAGNLRSRSDDSHGKLSGVC